MITWNNLDTLASFQDLKEVKTVDLKDVMSGENGAERVKKYSVPMAEGMAYNYATKKVDDQVLEALAKLAEEAQLAEKFETLYNGAVVNTGENRGQSVGGAGIDPLRVWIDFFEFISGNVRKTLAQDSVLAAAGTIVNIAALKQT